MSPTEDQVQPPTVSQNRRASAAETFERIMVPTTFRPWAIELLKLFTLKPGERVLDLACGTGIVARLAAEQVGAIGAVVGLDISPKMLEVAKSSSTRNGQVITWREGSAMALPLANSSFDVVLCQHGLQYFPYRIAALQEMRRVLVPYGRVGVAVWQQLEQNPGQAALNRALRRWPDSAARAVAEAGFSLGDTAELRSLFAAARFEDVKFHSLHKVARFHSVDEFIAAAFAAMNLDEAARAEVSREVVAALQPYVDADGIAIPTAAHLVTARA